MNRDTEAHRTDRKVLKRKTKVQTYKTIYRMKEGRTKEKS